ncbi:MAG: MFS transporter [Gammaproteobacteria bacterium]|nr:MFS transporter [Gammaproteobacteria bacterium]
MAILQGSALSLPTLVTAVPLGLAIDRYSRVRLLVVMAALDILGSVMTSFADDFTILVVGRCIVGFAVGAICTVVFSLVADLYIPSQRGRAGMVVVIGQFVGMSAAFGIGGFLLSTHAPEYWRVAMLWLSAPLIPACLLMLILNEPARAEVIIERPSIRQTCRQLWAYRGVIGTLAAGIVMVEVGVGAALTWSAPALLRKFAMSPAQVGSTVAMGLLISGVLGPVVGGMVSDMCQRAGGPSATLRVMAALALSAASVGCFAIASTVALASTLLIVFMTVVSALAVMGTVIFTILMPNEIRGLCLALLFGMCLLFGLGLGPLAVSVVSGAIGGPENIGRALAIVCVMAGLLGAALFATGRQAVSAQSKRMLGAGSAGRNGDLVSRGVSVQGSV